MYRLTFKIFEGFPVEAAFFSRGSASWDYGGREPDARTDWRKMAHLVGFEKVAQLRQVHGNRVIRVSGETLPPFEEADALVTGESGILLAVRVADCASVFLYDPVVKAVSLVHAGWRGLAGGIIANAVGVLKDDFGSSPGDLLAAVGPSLGPCCARFSHPEAELPQRFHPFIREGNLVDLWAITADQLKTAGVKEKKTELVESCTSCRPDLFYSHRKGDTRRMGAFLGLRQ
jgi:YfiH family protein